MMAPMAPMAPIIDSAPTLEEIQRILKMMADHGVTNLQYRGLTIVRVPERPGPSTPEAQRESARLAQMTPEAVDAQLYTQRYGGR